MSRYDRPDPSLDRDYTDGLELFELDSEPYRCLWCDRLLLSTDTDYCSTLCAVHAETDDCER